MKKLLSFIAVVLISSIAVTSAAADKGALLAKEKTAWQAFKDKKAADFQKLVSAKMIGVGDDGVAGMKKELSDMQKWNMKSFAISNYKVVAAGPDTVAVGYAVAVRGSYNGKDVSGTYYCGSVWANHGGEWQAVFHTTIKAAV